VTAAVHVRGLCFSHRDRPVLRDLSFSVEKGEFFIIIGPNGVGKTSLMRIISGFLKPGSGELGILGTPYSQYSPKTLARVIAVVSQAMPHDFPFTVFETVLMGRAPHLSLLGLEGKKDMEIALRAMALTQVDHLAKRRLDRLSGGELQRTFIARALAQEPCVILLDEPTASLDPAHQIRLMDLLETLRQEKGMTVVMVSHDLNLAAMYGDRLLLLKEGCLFSLGLAREVLKREVIEAAYHCPMLVDQVLPGGILRVTPVPQKYRTGAAPEPE
jgi:iron complex transport system ATP-binding protein